MSGIDLLTAIKKLPDRCYTAVVLYSGFADGRTVSEAFRAGAYDFLMKPVEAEDLAVVIGRLAEH